LASHGIAGRLVKGSAWIASARVIVNSLAALSTIAIAIFLTPADVGLVAIGSTLAAIATSVTEMSLSQALVRHHDPTAEHFSTVWSLGVLRGFLLFAAMAIAAYPVAQAYDDPRLTPIILWLGLGVFLSCLVNPRRVILQRKLVFWQDFVLNVSQKLAGVVASVAVAAIYQSYWALVVGAVVSGLTNMVVSFMAVPFRPRFTLRHWRELISFSGWLTAAQIMNTLNWRFDYLLIGKLLGQDPLGQYTVGSNLAVMPTREAILPLTLTLYPAFSALSGEPTRLAAAYQRSQAFITAIALPAGIGAALIADPMVRLLMGEKWAPAIFVIQSLGPVFALQTIGQFAQPLGMALGQTRLLFVRDLQLFFIRLPIIIVCTIMFGLTGLVLGRSFAGLFGIVFNVQLVKRFVEVGILAQFAVNGRALLSAAVMTAGTIALAYVMPAAQSRSDLVLEVAARVVTGGILFCGTMIGSWLLLNRPIGPENELIRLWRQFADRDSKPSAAASVLKTEETPGEAAVKHSADQ
jgi:O-antigen/teichoic acid export membrane protein